ncbi:ankyrin repeat domain protein [Nitzschia inconspicua]|uniref:Ankyrin repeat domain protein n=1 Tax=Nitzschia inconspicua TaxID=303405 RepID=A0A9K3KHR2_9STRA|nr:ankyrin repeat domain protein [Nitzschia inconspicua]
MWNDIITEDDEDDRKPPARMIASSVKRFQTVDVGGDGSGSNNNDDDDEDEEADPFIRDSQIRSESALPVYLDANIDCEYSPLTLASASATTASIGPAQRKLQQSKDPFNSAGSAAAAAGSAKLPIRSTAHHRIPRFNTAGSSPSSLTAVEFEPNGWQKEKNWNSLHVAMADRVEQWKIKLLLESNPGWEMEQTVDGNTPLHEGLKSQVDVTDLIPKEFATAVTIANNEGELPLHIACERKAKFQVLQALVKAFPQAVKTQTNIYHQTPFHYLMFSKSVTMESAKLLLDACSSAAKIRDKFGRTVLHMGIEYEADEDVLKLIYDAFPEAAGLKPTENLSSLDHGSVAAAAGSGGCGFGLNRSAPSTTGKLSEGLAIKFQDGMIKGEQLEERLKSCEAHGFRQRHHFNMLHVAVTKGVSVELIQLVLEMNPKMAEEQNTEGNCPLMEGLVAGASEEALYAILDGSEEVSCNCVNNNNEYALHLAVQKASPGLVRRILHANTAATMAQSLNEDEVPLHRLMASEYSEELVDEFLSKFWKARETARVRDRFGRTALHAAINNRAPKHTIMAVVKAFPDAIGIEDNHKRTPLDDCIFLDYIRKDLLTDAYEKTCRERGFSVNDILQEYKPRGTQINQGWNSLHVAMSKRADSWKVDILLKSSPNMARKQNEAGNFPLHEGLLHHGTPQSVVDVIAAHPDACITPNNNGEYALHHAAYASSSMIINMVQEIHPAAVSCVSTSSRRTPLHMLVGRQDRIVAVSSIERLARGNAINQRDINGDTPLHIAIKNSLSENVVTFLLYEYPNGAKIPDKQGHLPLHHAIRNQFSEDLLVNLLGANSDAVRMKFGDEGFLPLHLAMKYRAGSSFVSALIEQNDKVVSMKTSDGSTPLLMALKYDADFDSFVSVLSLYKGAWKVGDEEEMIPLHIALMRGAPKTIIATLIDAGPDAIKYRNNHGHTPFHAGIVPAMYVLHQRYPEHFQPVQVRGNDVHPASFLQNKFAPERDKNPLRDLLNILENLDEIISYFPEVSEQKDADGNLPLLLFCMTFNPSVIKLTGVDLQKAARAVTSTFENIYKANPQAAEVTGPFVGTPINVLVGECCMAKSLQQLLVLESSMRLSILLQNVRDGRALQPLCNLENQVSLFAFFVLFCDGHSLSAGKRYEYLSLDLNREILKGWSILDILADFDTVSSAGILLQILRDQKTKVDMANELIQITNEDGEKMIEFRSLEVVSETVRTRIADRAKLVNVSAELRLWGQAYGRFLKRYRLEKQPKHVSETCVVVFGTEAIKQEDGQIGEHPVALKFMCSRDTFLREIKKRPVLDDKGISSQYIFPIRETFSSRGIDEFKCEKVDLQTELEPYKDTIKLEGLDLKYVIVMDCGAGYDLHDFISHQNIAGKDLLTVTTIAKEIALCLKYLNEKCGIIHGDVKARNFVAKGVGFIGFAAIDLDNASTIGREHAGMKQTSSGYLPPEQAAIEAFERTYANDSSSPKPPSVIASCQYDMWCFGVLLYFLFTGKQLFNVDTKEDVDDEDLLRICSWDNRWKEEKLSKVKSKWPLKLLDSLLQKDPSNRPENWSSVVDELNKVTVYSDSVLYDKIVIFQSSPLVYTELNGNIKPMVQLDFEKELDMLKGALADAQQVGCTIDVVLETGSLDRLQAFMAQKMSRVMHFSGHGTLQYMAWEDERGKLKIVRESELKRQIEGIGDFLRCVFISACHSQWIAQAFIDAGVRHAICCPVDKNLMDIAASEFTRNFYRNLACKNTVKQAFKAAQTAVAISPHVANREEEAKKFMLLPSMPDDSKYHDVPLFFASDSSPMQDEKLGTLTIGVPRYRQLLVGRNVTKYSILSSLSPDSTIDVVRVWGREGMGKTALVADVCNHIRSRPRSPPQLDFLFWFPPTGQVLDNPIYQNIALLITSSIGTSKDLQSGAEELLRDIAHMLVHKSVLLIVDIREFQKITEGVTSKMFQEVFSHLLEVSHAKYLKAVFIEENPPTQTKASSSREETVPVMELDIDAAVTLFAHCIPEDLRRKYPILNSRDLCNHLLEGPEGIEINQDLLDKREDFVWERYLGSGEPSSCCDIARYIRQEDVESLLTDWWSIPANEPPTPATLWDDDDFPEFIE